MNSLLPHVGTAAVTENMLKRRWSTIILRHLDNGVNVPEDVIGREPGLSPAILSERLRAMLRYGMIARFPRPGPSSVVEFRLIARGRKILKILDLIEQLDQLDRGLVKDDRTLEQQFGLQPRERSARCPPSGLSLKSNRNSKPPNGTEMPLARSNPSFK